MPGTTARMMMMLVLAGGALAFSAQGAAAGGGAAGVTVIVNGDGWPGQHSFVRQGTHRFAAHRMHPAGPRAHHRWHGRHASGGIWMRDGHHGVPPRQRGAPHAGDLHHHHGRASEKPQFQRFAGHGFKGPRVLSFQRLAPRFKSHGVVVLRPSTSFDSFVRHHRQEPHHRGGKLIILSPSSDRSSHIIVAPSHSHWAE